MHSFFPWTARKYTATSERLVMKACSVQCFCLNYNFMVIFYKIQVIIWYCHLHCVLGFGMLWGFVPALSSAAIFP